MRTQDRSSLAPAGIAWDAIRTSRFMGLAAAERLGTSFGDAIIDPGARRMYLFVPPGTASTWDLESTRALGEGSYLSLPPSSRTAPPGSYWLTQPRNWWRLSNASALREALAEAAASPGGEVPAPAGPYSGYVTAECRLGQHGHCHGNTDIRRAGAPRWEAPIESLRCACTCGHRGRGRDANSAVSSS